MDATTPRGLVAYAFAAVYTVFVVRDFPRMWRHDDSYYRRMAAVLAMGWPYSGGMLPLLRALYWLWWLGLVVIALAVLPESTAAWIDWLLAVAFLLLTALSLAAAIGKPRVVVPPALRRVRSLEQLPPLPGDQQRG